MMTRLTLLRLMVALRVATAWEWVNPSRLASFTFSNKSPFWNNNKINVDLETSRHKAQKLYH